MIHQNIEYIHGFTEALLLENNNCHNYLPAIQAYVIIVKLRKDMATVSIHFTTNDEDYEVDFDLLFTHSLETFRSRMEMVCEKIDEIVRRA